MSQRLKAALRLQGLGSDEAGSSAELDPVPPESTRVQALSTHRTQASTSRTLMSFDRMKAERTKKNHDAAKAILRRMNGELEHLEDQLHTAGPRRSDVKEQEENVKDEEILRVQWKSVVQQAKIDMMQGTRLASTKDKKKAYKQVMRDLRVANRSPALDYLLVHFSDADEDGLCHGAIENLLGWFRSATQLVVGTIEAPDLLKDPRAKKLLAEPAAEDVFDGHLDDVAEWREISQLVFKVGRDLEIFTDVTAQMMKKTANAVHRKGIGAGGVPEAKAAMQQMLTCFQDAVKAMLAVNDVWGNDEETSRLLEEWDQVLSKDVANQKKMERLENAVASLETELEECHMKVHRLQREIESISSESEKRLQELEAAVDVTTCERDRTMHANEKLKNEMADLQGQLELALRKATWVDALTRDKDRLETLKEQLQRKVVDLNTDIADRAAAAVAKQKEFDELMKEVKAAREEEALHEETAASLGELQARHQAAKNQIEELENALSRARASAEIEMQAALQRAREQAAGQAASLTQALKKAQNDINEAKARNKALKARLQAAEKAAASPSPEPMEEMPQVEGGLTQDSTVEEVLEYLEGFQQSTLASPFSRADFAEGFVGLMDHKLRKELADRLRTSSPELFKTDPPSAPHPAAAANVQADRNVEQAAQEPEKPEVSCREDDTAIKSHATVQGIAKDEDLQMVVRPPRDDVGVNTDPMPERADAAANTDVKEMMDMPTQTEDVEPVDGGLENLTDVAVEESVVEKSQDAGGGKDRREAQVRDLSAEADQALGRARALESQLEDKARENQQLQMQLAKVEEEVSSHLASQQELAFKVREAEDKVLALSNSLSTANADLLNAQSAIDELQDSLGNQERRLNAEHAATINSLKEHKAQTMLLQTEKDSLAERVGELEELVRELMRDSSEMEDKLRAALETKSAELECRDDLRKLEALDSGLVAGEADATLRADDSMREDSPPQNFEHAELQTDGGARNGMLAAERLLKDPVNSSVPSARSDPVSMRTLAIQTTEDVISEAEAREMVSGVIALSESMLDRLSAKLSGIELVEKRLDDMWYISAVEGSELARAVEKVEDSCISLIGSAEGMQRHLSRIVALFPPMDVALGDTDRFMPWTSATQRQADPGDARLPHLTGIPQTAPDDDTAGGALALYTGQNADEAKIKFQQSVDLLTEVVSDPEISSAHPQLHQEVQSLITSYQGLLERIETCKRGQNTSKDVESIQQSTKKANHRFKKLAAHKAFNDVVKDKIREWEEDVCPVAGSSREMQKRYEISHRKMLAKMATALIQRQEKAERLFVSHNHHGYGSNFWPPDDLWANTVGLYQRGPRPATHAKKMQSADGHNKDLGYNPGLPNLSADWGQGSYRTTKGHAASLTPRPLDDSFEILSGWRAAVETPSTGLPSARKTQSEVKLPSISPEPHRRRGRASNKTNAFEVKLRKEPRLGLIGVQKT